MSEVNQAKYNKSFGASAGFALPRRGFPSAFQAHCRYCDGAPRGRVREGVPGLLVGGPWELPPQLDLWSLHRRGFILHQSLQRSILRLVPRRGSRNGPVVILLKQLYRMHDRRFESLRTVHQSDTQSYGFRPVPLPRSCATTDIGRERRYHRMCGPACLLELRKSPGVGRAHMLLRCTAESDRHLSGEHQTVILVSACLSRAERPLCRPW